MIKTLCLCLVVVATGCSPVYYAPPTVNVPMLAAKGDGAVSIHAGDHGSTNVDAAYSPKSHFGVLADFYRVHEEDTTGTFFETGAGLYRHFKERFLVDAYGIVGFGHVKNDIGVDVTANLIRYGVQPSFSFRSRYFDASLASHFVNLTYRSIGGSWTEEVQYLGSVGSQFLIEPVATIRVGHPVFKVQIQGGRSHNATDGSFKQSKGIVSVGVVYIFGKSQN